MSKKAVGMGKSRMMNKAVLKIVRSNLITTHIPAGMASAGPPLGPKLGQYGLNIASFCKDFNNRTTIYKEGIPLAVRILLNPDRSYELELYSPPSVHFLKQAAGIQRGAMDAAKEIAGKTSLRHIYEIALIKKTDRSLLLTPMKQIVEMLIGTAHSIGIEVVKDLDPGEYASFLDVRRVVVDEQLLELQEKKEAKLLRK